MTDNLDLWNALSRTDPKHTKSFSRAGGFKGTALKPIWIVKALTERFGPCGVGWGIEEPTFQVVPADGEILVYCTVAAWHGHVHNKLYGVGGDKVTTKRQSGSFNDDEAFKKAFTDAVGNAFKFIGVGADIHMGMFEDSKYLEEVREEYEAKEREAAPMLESTKLMLDAINKCETLLTLRAWLKANKDAALESSDSDLITGTYNTRKTEIEAMDRSAA